MQCEQRVLHCPPRCQKVLLTQLQISHFLFGNVEELLQKLDPLCFTHQHVDCLHTLIEYRLKGYFVVKSGQVFDNVQRAVSFFSKKQVCEQNAQHRKKEILEEKVQKTLTESFQKTNGRKPVDQSLQKELNEKKTNYELELIEIVDCFLDGYVSYCSNLVTFEIFISLPNFATKRELKTWSGSANVVVITAIISPTSKKNQEINRLHRKSFTDKLHTPHIFLLF